MIHGAEVARWAGNPEVPGSIPGGLLFGVQYICEIRSDILCSYGYSPLLSLSKWPYIYVLGRTRPNMSKYYNNINIECHFFRPLSVRSTQRLNPIQPERGPLDPGRLQLRAKTVWNYIFLFASVTFPKILSSFTSRKQKLIIFSGFRVINHLSRVGLGVQWTPEKLIFLVFLFYYFCLVCWFYDIALGLRSMEIFSNWKLSKNWRRYKRLKFCENRWKTAKIAVSPPKIDLNFSFSYFSVYIIFHMRKIHKICKDQIIIP